MLQNGQQVHEKMFNMISSANEFQIQMQIKTIIRYYFISTRRALRKLKRKIASVGEDPEKLEPSNITGRIAMEKESDGFSVKLNTELPYNPVILLRDVHPND